MHGCQLKPSELYILSCEKAKNVELLELYIRALYTYTINRLTRTNNQYRVPQVYDIAFILLSNVLFFCSMWCSAFVG